MPGDLNILKEGIKQSIASTKALASENPPKSEQEYIDLFAETLAAAIDAYMTTIVVAPGQSVQVVPMTGTGSTIGVGTLQ